MGTTTLAWLITILGMLMIAGGIWDLVDLWNQRRLTEIPLETLGYCDCNDLRRVWHARYSPGLTPVAHSGRSGCGGP